MDQARSIGKNANYGTVLAMRIYILALQDTFDTGLSTLLDTFSVANELAASSMTLTARFDVTIVGVRSRVTTSHGLSIPVEPAKGLARPDVALVPAVGAKMPDTLRIMLARREIVDAQSLLRGWFQRGTMLWGGLHGHVYSCRDLPA